MVVPFPKLKLQGPKIEGTGMHGCTARVTVEP